MKIEGLSLIIKTQKFSESSLILTLFSQNKGLIKGYFKPAKKQSHGLTPATLGHYTKQARLAEHLGFMTFESQKNYFSKLGFAANKLKILNATLELIFNLFREDEPHEFFFAALINYLEELDATDDLKSLLALYINFEFLLLSETGFGLDFTRCSVTGSRENLIYISPKSGAVVCEEVGRNYHDKLLPVPKFFSHGLHDCESLLAALAVAEFILKRFAFPLLNVKRLKYRNEVVNLLMPSATYQAANGA
jgi:DNA repair protein RecO (recombination protein O)